MDETKKFWDKQAKNYDNSEKQFEPAFKKILIKTKKYLNPTDVILDFSCATGTKALKLAPNVKMLHGIDIAPKMVEEANKKAEKFGIKNIEFSAGTIFDNRLKRDSFDVITSFGVIHLLEEAEKVMKRINELLKKDGLFISSTACLKDKMTFRSKFELSLYLFVKKIGLFPLHLNMYKICDVENLIRNGNFQILKSEKIYHGISISFNVAKKVDGK